MDKIRTLLLLFLCIILVASFGLSLPGRAQQGTDPQVLEQGARLYQENCVMCHGENGKGRVGATLSKNWPSIRPDLRIKETISDGVPGSPMPAWSQAKGGPLSEAEIDTLVAYILSWESGEPFVIPTQPTITARPPITPLSELQGDANRGAVLYDLNCAVCHGLNGEGRVGARLARSWSSLRPDLEIKAAIENGVSGSPMPAWGQAKGGPLSEQDIEDLTAFILSLKTVSGEPAIAATEATAGPGMSGATGVLLTILLFTLIVSLILFAQRGRKNSTG